MREEIKQFIEKRPEVKGAYGYGSGVFKQSGYTQKDKPQIDLILVVEDLKKWHLENIKLNKNDYSMIGNLFFHYAPISKIKGLTGVAYLSNIKEDGKIYKYGTIEEKDLELYLNNWKSFYLPGRFQKAILPIIESQKITVANQNNREKVLLTALLTLSDEKHKLIDVYTQICGLSYLGDTRMKFAENPRKVLNIVEGSFNSLKEIYGTSNQYFKTNRKEEVSIDYPKIMNDIDKLPECLLEYLGDVISTKDLKKIREKILEYFTELNKKESSMQTVKGIYTNGVVRSISYASQKVLKKIKK